MSKYLIEAEVTIGSTIEPQGYLSESNLDRVENFDTESFGGSEDVSAETRITFEYETEASDDDVEDEVQTMLSDHLSYDGDDVEWEIQDVTILSCEKQQMSLHAAKLILLDFCGSYNNDGANDELIAAIKVILDQI